MNEFDSFYCLCCVLALLFIILYFLIYRFRNLLKLENTFGLLFLNALLIICFVSTIFLVGETYYRFFVDTTDSFALNKISQRWTERHYQDRNNRRFDPKIPEGKRRVTIIGDSFTKGHGIKNSNDRFANLVQENHPEFEVHVLAKNGANSVSELKLLLEIASTGYELDLVILAYCLNDIDYLIDKTAEIYRRIRSFNNHLNYLEQNSYFINFLSFRWFAFNDPDLLNYSDFVLEGYSGDSWKKQQKVLKKIKKTISQLNGKMLVVTFPFLQQKLSDYPFKEVHSQLDNFWQSENVSHLSLLTLYTPYLGKKLVVNRYDAHPNEFAHKLAADAIDKQLEEFFKRE